MEKELVKNMVMELISRQLVKQVGVGGVPGNVEPVTLNDLV